MMTPDRQAFAAMVQKWKQIIAKEEAGEQLTEDERALLFDRPSFVSQAELSASRYATCFAPYKSIKTP